MTTYVTCIYFSLIYFCCIHWKPGRLPITNKNLNEIDLMQRKRKSWDRHQIGCLRHMKNVVDVPLSKNFRCELCIFWLNIADNITHTKLDFGIKHHVIVFLFSFFFLVIKPLRKQLQTHANILSNQKKWE